MSEYEIIIIGGGPAGLTAGLYASRAGLRTLLLERGIFGGQIVNAQRVENYPGFPDAISGFDLASLMHQQAIQYGLEVKTAEVTGFKSGRFHDVLTTEGSFKARGMIIATGSEYNKLGVAGEEKFVGRGVSYCATCDGFLFKDRDVAVVGGGDTAITDALEVGQHASRVYVIHRRDQLRAGEVLQKRALSHPKLKFVWNTVVDEITGAEMVKELKLRDVKESKLFSLPVDGVFVAVGLKPNSQHFAGTVAVNETGHIITDSFLATSVPGIFAAGDIRKDSARQVATAVGDGAAAAISAFKYIREQAG